MANEPRSQTIKLGSVSNSKDIRPLKNQLQKYDFSNSLILDDTDHGLLLHKVSEERLSWEETYQAIALENEEWSDLDVTLQDGLEKHSFDSEVL